MGFREAHCLIQSYSSSLCGLRCICTTYISLCVVQKEAHLGLYDARDKKFSLGTQQVLHMWNMHAHSVPTESIRPLGSSRFHCNVGLEQRFPIRSPGTEQPTRVFAPFELPARHQGAGREQKYGLSVDSRGSDLETLV